MSELRKAYTAWGDFLDHVMREPTDAELAALMPVDHPIDISKMTVGEIQDLQKNLLWAKQKRDLIGLLIKETAYARRNEHHQMSKLFTNAELKSFSQSTLAALKRRFAELNEIVKGAF